MALAATVFTAILSASGSGAAASDILPVLAKQAPTGSPLEFVSRPVIQPLTAPMGNGGDASSDTGSLAQLVAQQAMPQALTNDMRCLAGAIYFESRGESLEGQLAVGRVVINRAQSGRFPSSYCGVVYQPSQFSFVRDGSMPVIREDSAGWREAVAVAQIAQDGSWNSPAPGALFFHAARVSPGWHLTRLARVDNHVFYR